MLSISKSPGCSLSWLKREGSTTWHAKREALAVSNVKDFEFWDNIL
jgi:hypothetical protein